MPCIICRDTLKTSPCEHRTGIISDYEFETEMVIDGGRGWFKASHLPVYVVGYKELHHKCPCKECLIKMICTKNSNDADTSDICEEYYKLIKSFAEEPNAVPSV